MKIVLDRKYKLDMVKYKLTKTKESEGDKHSYQDEFFNNIKSKNF